MIKLFDALVTPILNYGCEIWGFSNVIKLDCVHRKFCKWLLNVKTTTNTLSVYGELGRFPLIIERQIRAVKYWFKLCNTDTTNCILRTVYKDMYTLTEINGKETWLKRVKCLLQRSGYPDVWTFPSSVTVHKFIPFLRLRLRDLYISEWREGMSQCTSLTLYRELKPVFVRSEYLTLLRNFKYRRAISRLRVSSHKLNIESGRHAGIARADRFCSLCNLNDIEDEYHFILICPVYAEIRSVYINSYYYRRPSVYKLVQLLSSDKFNVLKKLALYIIEAFKMRDSL